MRIYLIWLGIVLPLCIATELPAGEPTVAETPADMVSGVLPAGTAPADSRLGKPRKLRDAYHPWKPASTREAWKQQATAIRKRVKVSTGLWPLPPKTPLQPVIHGKMDRGDYTIEKVYFASYPGHYVTGNLYRPKNIDGPVPGVLCPHGHWSNGRFYDAGQKRALQQIEKGAETFLSGARYPVQARMVQLARMGCIVFHYDMVGYADSQQIPHRQGFRDVQAGLWLQNFMGLQTYNSIRALDFLLSRGHVDPERIGVTGASGGGTQTFMLGAVDPRPDVAFPAVMVSTAMQGGCVCENASYLRIGLNNIALAALFAPKPLAMTGADDWTIDIETKGLPELKQVYSHYGKKDLVTARAFPQFQHNYNEVSREVMYNWFNRHLGLGEDEPVRQSDFWPVPPERLSVWTEKHSLPEDATSAKQLREQMKKTAEEQFRQLLPEQSEQVARYRRIVGTAARILLDDGLPADEEIEGTKRTRRLSDDLLLMKGTYARQGTGQDVPYAALIPEPFGGTAVIWIDEAGKSHLFNRRGEPKSAVRKLLGAGRAVVSADVFLTGEYLAGRDEKADYLEVNEQYHGYTFGYNRPVLSERVRDILTLIAATASHERVQTVHLVGTGKAGLWAILARALAEETVERTLVDANGFSFRDVTATDDPRFLPGALKYGDWGGLAALAAPASLRVSGLNGVPASVLKPLKRVYEVAGGNLKLQQEPLQATGVPAMLLTRSKGEP